ncbi:hypothetical protein, partial [Streptococcus pneumoniae]|uniref:hypothetical protein n=1 Tax=Streptococcus pneumoniae TaxID=1313 RepID=UPI001E289E8A
DDLTNLVIKHYQFAVDTEHSPHTPFADAGFQALQQIWVIGGNDVRHVTDIVHGKLCSVFGVRLFREKMKFEAIAVVHE